MRDAAQQQPPLDRRAAGGEGRQLLFRMLNRAYLQGYVGLQAASNPGTQSCIWLEQAAARYACCARCAHLGAVLAAGLHQRLDNAGVDLQQILAARAGASAAQCVHI